MRRIFSALGKMALVVGSLSASVSAAPVPIGPCRPGFDPDRGFPLAPLPAPAAVVYDNIGGPLGLYLGGFGPYDSVADDVALAPGPRIFSRLEVEYYGKYLEGDETVRVRIHTLNGPPTPGSFGFNTPGTVLWERIVPVGNTDPGVGVISAADPVPSVVLPDVVAVSLEPLFEVGPADEWGPTLHDPPSLGSPLDDYWLMGYPNPGDPWSLFTFGGNPPINLALRITTVPEPSCVALLSSFGLLFTCGYWWRRRRAA
jgi:hypothetical protein